MPQNLSLAPLTNNEALRFWQSKKILSDKEAKTLSREARVFAFYISGMAKNAHLKTIYKALYDAIEKGIPFKVFKKNLATIEQKMGFKSINPYRLRFIFQNNIQTAYNVGRYKQMMRSQTRIYWQYSAVNDSRTRPTHRAMHGKIFPKNSPVWDVWYPPNGHRCRCIVNSLSKREIERDGLTVSEEVPALAEPINPLTGGRDPAIPLVPDRGWNYNPAKSFWQGIAPKEEEINNGAGWVRIGKRETYKTLKRPAIKDAKDALLNFSKENLWKRIPTALSGTELKKAEEEYIDRFTTIFKEKLEKGLFVDAVGEGIIVDKALFQSVDGKTKLRKQGRESYLPLLAETIMNPWEIWQIESRNVKTGEIQIRRRYIRGFKDKNNLLNGFVSFEYGYDGWSGITAFQPKNSDYLDKQREGRLIFAEDKEGRGEQ